MLALARDKIARLSSSTSPHFTPGGPQGDDAGPKDGNEGVDHDGGCEGLNDTDKKGVPL